jgi:hypothetical protein
VQNRDELDQLAFQRFCELLPIDAPREFHLNWRKMGDLAKAEGLIAPMTAGELEASPHSVETPLQRFFQGPPEM